MISEMPKQIRVPASIVMLKYDEMVFLMMGLI